MDRPSAADLPRPRAAVMVTIERRVFSEMASTNLRRALAWSRVFVCDRSEWAGWVPSSDRFSSLSSSSDGDWASPCDLGAIASISSVAEETGNTLSWSSTTKHWPHELSDKIKRSLNLGKKISIEITFILIGINNTFCEWTGRGQKRKFVTLTNWWWW